MFLSRLIRVLCLTALALGSAQVWAAGKAGGTGAAFLKITPGARPAALGGAVTGLADDATATLFNPAGLARLEKPEFTATHTQWLQGANQESLAAAHPAAWGALGVSAVTLGVDDIPKRLTDTAEADSQFESKDAAYTLAYARGLGDRLSLGMGLSYIRQTLDSRSAGAPAASLGALWKAPGWSLGAAVRNIGGDLEFNDTGDPLPLTAALGGAGRLWKDRLTLVAEGRWVREADLAYGAGVEWDQPLGSTLAGRLRAGYDSAAAGPADGTGLALGVGLGFRSWSVDVTWAPYGVLGDTFRYAFRMTF